MTTLNPNRAPSTKGLKSLGVLPPPSFSTTMTIMLWKNLTIRKRRKLEQLLMLFSIFLWFGFGASRFLFRGMYQFMPAVAPTRHGTLISLYKHMILPANQPIAVSVSNDPDWTFPNPGEKFNVSPSHFRDILQNHSAVDGEFLHRSMAYFADGWARTVGFPEIRFHEDEGTTAKAMREDMRIAFHFHFERLLLDDDNISISLVFWDREIPLETTLSGHGEACRTQEMKLSGALARLHSEAPSNCEAGKYLTSSFVLAQSLLLNAVLLARMELVPSYNQTFLPDAVVRTTLQNRLELPGLSMVAEDFPLHSTINSHFPDLANGTPLFIMFAFSRFMVSTLQDLVADKESKLKEVLKIFGLSNSQLWLSSFATSAIMNVVYTLITIVIAKCCRMFPGCSYIVMGVFFYFYLLSLSTFGMLLSVFFDKQQSAGAVGIGINFILHGVGWLMTIIHEYRPIVRLLFCAFSTITFSLGLDETIRGLPMRTVTLSNWFDPSVSNMGLYTILLMCNAFGYFLLAWYLDYVLTGSFGTSKAWYFPIIDVYQWMLDATGWGPLPEPRLGTYELPAELSSTDGNLEKVSPILASHGCAVCIRNLVKEFKVQGDTVRAVNDLSLDIYRSEIFALLGHNGAGKTTTISILTGMLTSDGGNAWVNGFNIRENPREVQRSISVCPQHNIFIDELTCIEHLCLFATLRGIDTRKPLLRLQNPQKYAEQIMRDFHGRQMQEQIHGPAKEARSETKTWEGVIEMIYRFGLTSKLFQHPRALSGGQKRRLWLALALMAEPTVVFLDEPTSGVDPVGRQDIWRVIQEERKAGRCIILTTHHMEEADILADRKAVMSQGCIRCLGSSLFLKTKFGVGYYLEIELFHGDSDVEQVIRKLTEVITSHVSDAKRVTATGTLGTMAAVSASAGMIIYALPLAQVDKFGRLLKLIEGQKSQLQIKEYAISMSTLEEVFFKLGEEGNPTQDILQTESAPEDNALRNLGTHGRGSSSSILRSVSGSERNGLSSTNLAGDLVEQKFPQAPKGGHMQQLRGITYLRYAQIFHNKAHFFLDIILPTVLFLLGLLLRVEGLGSVGAMFQKPTVDHNFSDFSIFLNTSIPYMVDPQFSDEALGRISQLLSNIPFRTHLLPLLDIMQADNLATCSSDMLREALHSGSVEASLHEDVLASIPPEPTSTRQFLARSTPNVKSFHLKSSLDPEDMAYVFYVDNLMEKTTSEGLFLRNFIWTTTTADMYGTWKNFYPAALHFEPGNKRLSDTNALGLLEIDTNSIQVRLLWNPYAIHSFPTILNGLSNAIYKTLWETDKNAPISIHSKPMYQDLPIFVTTLTWALYSLLSLGLSSLPQRFGSQVMFDRATKTKHSLIVMGCPFQIYWVGTFLINWCVMLLANTCVIGAIVYFIPLYRDHPASIFAMVLAMCSYSAAMLAYGYFWTFVFQYSRSYNLFMNLSIMTCALMPAYLVTLFHDTTIQIGGIPLPTVSRILHRLTAFTLAPYTPLGCMIACIIVINRAHAEKRTAELYEFFDFHQGVVWTIIGALFQSVVYFALIFHADSKQYTSKRPSRFCVISLKHWKEARAILRQRIREQGGDESMLPLQFQSIKDKDVLLEEENVNAIMDVLHVQEAAKASGREIPRYFRDLSFRPPQDLPPIIIHNLHHVYMPSSGAADPTVAVKGLSLSVSRGEVMGLLGPNGAGKSTTINLLTCDSMLDAPSEGDGYLGGISMTAMPRKAFPYIGLVPQFDALWPDVSVSDNLRVFANIKKVPKRMRPVIISRLVAKIGLTPHLNKRIKELSGGNKRRTSVAVAFLGNPRVILMDEPSSGIDPAGRRQLLELIQSENKDRAVIITTHSMEEAESLCTKIGIVVNGELQCYNTCMAIKNQYGAGIRLEVELRSSDWKQTGRMAAQDRQRILNFVRENLTPEGHLVEEVASRLTFLLPVPYSSFGHLFDVIHSKKEEMGIKEYALSQPTLDQVFIKFAKRQQAAPPPREPDAA